MRVTEKFKTKNKRAKDVSEPCGKNGKRDIQEFLHVLVWNVGHLGCEDHGRLDENEHGHHL